MIFVMECLVHSGNGAIGVGAGVVKILDCKLTVPTLNAHVALLDQFRKDVVKLKADAEIETDYNECKKCHLFYELKVQALVPQVLELVA